jgi:YidC/Oxa1 family membrane protein insertase
MELRRTLIIIAMAVVSYLLFLDWQKDYGNLAAAPVPAVAQTQGGNTLPELPAASNAANNNAGLPSLPASPAVAGAVASASAPAVGGLTHVHTDVLDLQINLAGGDIVDLRLPAFTRSAASTEPFQLLENTAGRSYIARSGLIGGSGIDNDMDHRPLFQAGSEYVLPAGAKNLDVVLSLPAHDGVQIDKVFHFTRGSYLVNVSYRINNQSSKAWDGFLFGQLRRDGSADPSSNGSRFGMSAFIGGAWASPEKTYNKLEFKKFGDPDKKLKESMTGGWAAIVQHYFLSAWVPDKNSTNQFETSTDAGKSNYFISFVSAPVHADAGKSASVAAGFYAGPKVQDELKTISPGLELTVDYGLFWFIAQYLFKWMTFIFTVIGNWGWTIVLLTLSIKLAFFWLSARSYRSMANMRRVMPEMQKLKDLHANDRQKLGLATMELYKKEGVNPLGGCLPILVQIPVFMALYATLGEAVELRHAHWLWITDLSVMDPWFALPIAMGVSMFAQQMLNPPPPDPTQAKVMKLMPIMFTFMFLWLPAGLALYMLVNNLLSIAQQWVITRNVEKAAAAK